MNTPPSPTSSASDAPTTPRKDTWMNQSLPGGFFKRRLNLGIKLPLFTIILLALGFMVSTFLSVRATQKALVETLKNELNAQTKSKAELIQAYLIWTRGAAIDLAAAAEVMNYDEEGIRNVIRNTLMRNEQVFGSTIAYEPNQFKPDLYYWSPYYNRGVGTELLFTQLGSPEYNYFNRQWYSLPKATGKPVLSPPYFDDGGGNIWMVTWSAPFFDEAGKFKGVATADIAFSQIQEIVNEIEVGQRGYAFLLDSHSKVLGIGENSGGNYEPMVSYMLDVAYSPSARGWAELTNSMQAGAAGFAEATDPQGNSLFVAYAPVGLETGWSLALAFPRDELLQKASSPQNTLIFYAGLTLIVFGALLYVLTRSITTPLRHLTEYASQLSAEKLKLTEGKLTQPIEIHTRDEIEDLAEAFNQMSDELAQAFETLETKVADRSRDLERRSLELETIAEVAREITIIHDIDTLLNVSANLICERFRYYHVGIFLVDERGEYAILRAASGAAASQMIEQGYKLRVGQEGLVGSVTRTGQADVAFDIETAAMRSRNPFLPQTRSEIALPLRSRSITTGALDIHADTQSAFSEHDIKALQLLADQLAAAIENAQLVEQVENALAELNKTYNLQTQGAWRSTINQYERPAYEYDGIQVRPVPQNLPASMLKQLEYGEPVVIRENDRQGTTLMVPLMVLNQIIGVIGLEHEDPNHVWTAEETTIAQAAANRAGITLENARLLEESQRRAMKERAIFDATARIGSVSNIGNILHVTAEEIERVLGNTEVILQINNDNASSINEE